MSSTKLYVTIVAALLTVLGLFYAGRYAVSCVAERREQNFGSHVPALIREVEAARREVEAARTKRAREYAGFKAMAPGWIQQVEEIRTRIPAGEVGQDEALALGERLQEEITDRSMEAADKDDKFWNAQWDAVDALNKRIAETHRVP